MVEIFFVEGADALPNIGLSPTGVTSYFLYKKLSENIDDVLHLSHYYTYEYPMRILAKTRIGSEHMLRVFRCFESGVYFAILVSILVISCVFSAQRKSLRGFVETIWAFVSALLSQCHSYPDKTLSDRLMSFPWLIGCVIMIAAFSGTLRDQILKGEDIHWIDSLRDLYKWKHITKLQYHHLDDFYNYLAKNNSDSMRQDFDTRKRDCYTLNIQISGNQDHESDCILTKELDFQGVFDGSTALIFQKSFIYLVKREFFKFGWRENIDYHVSKYDTYSQPVFMITNKLNLEKEYEAIWDQS